MKFIKTFNFFINENRFQDDALDKINALGGFDKLPDIDKLALLSDSDKESELKKLSLTKIFKENGGTFGMFMIKVRIKDISEQPIEHKFSQEFAGKDGWLYPYFHYSDEKEAYITVRFDEFISDEQMKGGGTYEERPIMLDNMYPIGYNEIKSDFVKYHDRVEADRQAFMDDMKEFFEDDDNNDI